MIDENNAYQSNNARSDTSGYDVGAYMGGVYGIQTVGDHDVYVGPNHATRLSPTDVLVNINVRNLLQ